MSVEKVSVSFARFGFSIPLPAVGHVFLAGLLLCPSRFREPSTRKTRSIPQRLVRDYAIR